MSGGVGVPGFVPRAFFAGREGRRMFALAHGMYATPGTSVGWRVASDSGVSSDRFGEVFERLFTTKGQAIGMPLCGTCTIVDLCRLDPGREPSRGQHWISPLASGQDALEGNGIDRDRSCG